MSEALDLDVLCEQVVKASIWGAAKVPALEISAWQVLKFTVDGVDKYHFLGYASIERGGRLSTPIQKFGKDADGVWVGQTASGTLYSLIGPSGHDGDAEYVLGGALYNGWRGYSRETPLVRLREADLESIALAIGGSNNEG